MEVEFGDIKRRWKWCRFAWADTAEDAGCYWFLQVGPVGIAWERKGQERNA